MVKRFLGTPFRRVLFIVVAVATVLAISTLSARSSRSASNPVDGLAPVRSLLIGEAIAENSPNSVSYPSSGVQSGVYNNGQAAFWDLDIFDHFHIFGPVERAKGHKPEQPINFSHITHVQKNQMDCQFCHWNVAKGPYASIPEVETCMGCHTWVKGQTPEQQAEIAKIQKYWVNGGDTSKSDPIPWVKVHVMPDHVKFNHKRHVKAGVSCQSCHGQVPEMEVVERVSSMKMGWCISCHREAGTSIDCNVCHY